ncbi:MAG: hypothetical protein CR982_03190 [Candidatus Cloacimonadota bacterium]|nr:MAG: hypothetical protein CR982_03190 [Candidatus Cloacimonadota bacterium]PIE77441.1 MAG: hypothetical protein CSA15_13140 [Candidatus Delongbacteria bacterium]
MKNKEIDSEKIITKNKITEDIDSEIIKPKKIDKKSRNIVINIREQKMYLYSGEEFLKKYDISSSSYGVGSEPGSNKTPLGKHVISEKFGDKAELGTIFIGRINTGRISDIYYDDKDRDTDSVLTRVLWLDGIEKGNKNSKERYIYIHGTPEEGLIGKVASHGCIRMRNSEVIELFDSVEIGTIVDIREN